MTVCYGVELILIIGCVFPVSIFSCLNQQLYIRLSTWLEIGCKAFKDNCQLSQNLFKLIHCRHIQLYLPWLVLISGRLSFFGFLFFLQGHVWLLSTFITWVRKTYYLFLLKTQLHCKGSFTNIRISSHFSYIFRRRG